MEHLQACSGNMGVLDQGFLQALRGRDELVLGLATGALGSGEEGRLRRGLTDKLLRAVPPPGEFSGGPSGEPSDPADPTPDPALVAEVEDFVESYLELLALKGLMVPQLADGRTPLQVAHNPLCAAFFCRSTRELDGGAGTSLTASCSLPPQCGCLSCAQTLPASNRDVQSEAMNGLLLGQETTPLAFARTLEKAYDERVSSAHTFFSVRTYFFREQKKKTKKKHTHTHTQPKE